MTGRGRTRRSLGGGRRRRSTVLSGCAVIRSAIASRFVVRRRLACTVRFGAVRTPRAASARGWGSEAGPGTSSAARVFSSSAARSAVLRLRLEPACTGSARLLVGCTCLLVVQVAEDDRLGRARLLAGRLEVAQATSAACCVQRCCASASSAADRLVGLGVELLQLDARRLTRCTQYVHFSITPRLRTVTSGLRMQLQRASTRGSSLYWRKLNRRTLYGQLFEQYRVPTQRL